MGGRGLVQTSRNPPDNGQSDLIATPGESDILKGIRLWMLKTVLPGQWTVRQGQQNRAVVMQTPFAIMQIISRNRYATNSHINSPDGSVVLVSPERLVIQITTFGAGAGGVASLLNATWRDSEAVRWFRENLPRFAPLYASNLMQHAFTNAEHQYEDQWSVDLHADVKTTLTLPGQSALQLGMKQIFQVDNQTHETE